jgi:glycosyltransferase involved in cell wall biosynthesis
MTRALVKSGVEVDVVTTDDNGTRCLDVPLNEPVLEDGVTYHYFHRQFRPYIVSIPLAKWVFNEIGKYDVAHIHVVFSWASTMAAWAAAARGVPYVIRPLGVLNRWGMENRRPLLKRMSCPLLERRSLENAAAIQYTSEQERDEAERLPFHGKGAVIGNPVDVPECRPARGAFRSRHPEIGDKFMYLYLSRIDAKKGVELLISALANARNICPEALLVIAGDGPVELVSALRQQAARLGLTNAILWVGFLEGSEKWEAIADADAFVLSSYSENFGVAVVEAMALGIPVIVSDQVGISSMIQTAGAGIVTECNADDLGRALVRLGTNPGLREQLGISARRMAESEFSSGAISKKLIDLYQSVQQNRRDGVVRKAAIEPNAQFIKQ